jgi:hypothetical protein
MKKRGFLVPDGFSQCRQGSFFFDGRNDMFSALINSGQQAFFFGDPAAGQPGKRDKEQGSASFPYN